ncbi:protein CURVATURE THYLAKOID 1D, chloroplastic-like [Benincasa hispida]|uniref:protein CURVATURE THYLAKOID 1D, chloroplastic-like n=1 Tax=Benincasa hispida TaxID=102211 RepID=UPI0019011B56|nr:protein CURVATURE THYLAKOID 1D, chloroplastic-like [Benincasa hispida]
MAMDLSPSSALFSSLLAGNPHLRPIRPLPLRIAIPTSSSTRTLHSWHRHFAVSLPRAAASDDSNGSSSFFTEERDSVTVLEDSPSVSSVALEDSPAEKLPSEVPKEEPVEDVPVVTLEDSSPAGKVETVASEEPKEEAVEGAQEQGFELLNDFKLESVDTYSLILYGAGAFFGIWLVSAVIGAVDSIPLVPKLLEVVGLGYSVWFTARYLLFKESRDELAAKIDEVKEQVLGSD